MRCRERQAGHPAQLGTQQRMCCRKRASCTAACDCLCSCCTASLGRQDNTNCESMRAARQGKVAGLVCGCSGASYAPGGDHAHHCNRRAAVAAEYQGDKRLRTCCCWPKPRSRERSAAQAPAHAWHSPMRPYSASASAKIRIRIIPTNSLGC